MSAPSPLAAGWQDATATALVRAAAGMVADLRVLVVGSCAAAPAGLDALSDLDLALVVTSADEIALGLLGDPAWLLGVAPIWAYELQSPNATGTHGAGRRVLRVVFVDGRRVDLLVQTGLDGLPEPRRELPTPAAARSAPIPAWSADEVVPELVNRVRHDMALAIVKLGRGDLLIGAHLALQVVRHTLVVSMLLRDREQGTTVHHAGTDRDRDATAVSAVLAGLPVAAGPTDWLDVLDGVRAPFDAAASALWPAHAADWRGADVLAATARAARSAAIGSMS